MTTTAGVSVWDTLDHTPSPKQRAFLRYLTATLVDLVVLGLFVEYWEHVVAESFTVILLAAVVLQVLLKVTIIFEHKVLDWFKGKTGAWMTFLKYFCAWLILFGSKFVILEALAQAFGDKVKFLGSGQWDDPRILNNAALVGSWYPAQADGSSLPVSLDSVQATWSVPFPDWPMPPR